MRNLVGLLALATFVAACGDPNAPHDAAADGTVRDVTSDTPRVDAPIADTANDVVPSDAPSDTLTDTPSDTPADAPADIVLPDASDAGCTFATECDDSDLCTQDLCGADGTCSHVAATVDDGNACTTDSCDSATGVQHTMIAIDDGNACTMDSCDTASGAVAHTAIAIDDSNACTSDAYDMTSGAVSHTPTTTDDGNVCTADSCDPTTGAVSHTPVSIDDSNACTADSCDPATGVSHVAMPVDDSDACTVDACDSASGAITHAPVPTDDSVACTVDSCDPATGTASHTPNDSACPVGRTCNATTGCTFRAVNLVITEFGNFSDGAGELVEIYNADTVAAHLRGYQIANGAGALATIVAASDPSGSAGTDVVLAPGAYAYGVPNPAAASSIPAGAAFVYGAPGTAFDFNDAGDAITLLDPTSAVVDLVDFTNLVSDPATPIGAGQFPAFHGHTTQLDPASLTATANDSGDRWCVTFRAQSTRGSANGSCSAFVVNEVLYDYAHPVIGTGDDGNTFVELAGPGGGHLDAFRVQGTNAAGTTINEPNVTFAANTRMPVDGIFVIGDNVSGSSPATTNVPNVDLIATCDPTNGNTGNLVRLLEPGGMVQDVLGYGPGAVGEGTSVTDIDPNRVAISIARDLQSTDTNDNTADFHFDPTPSPGLANAPVNPQVLSVSPQDGLATTTTVTTWIVRDFGNVRGAANVALSGNDLSVVFAGNTVPATDTSTQNEGCQITDVTRGGRGDATLLCTAPANGGTATRAALTLSNPALLGGATVFVSNGWTYTGVRNETDVPLEADYCVLQFPPTTSTRSGMTSELLYGRIFEASLTPSPGSDATIVAQVGYGAFGSNPTTASGWVWTPAAFNLQAGNDDEYFAGMIAPAVTATTHYAYTYRFSLDGGRTYTYCDLNGAGSNAGLTFEANQLGDWTVTP